MRYRTLPRGALEKKVEQRIDELCANAGCESVHFSQARATKQSFGIPDRRYYPREGPAFWVEVKAEGGRQTESQAAFEDRCRRCGDPYVLGGYREVLAYLITRGLWRLPAGMAVGDVCRDPPFAGAWPRL